MAYISYVLVILGALAVLLILVRLPGRSRLAGSKDKLANRTRERHAFQEVKMAKRAARAELEFRKETLQRGLQHVPTPWGWPGHDGFAIHEPPHRHGAYAPLQRSVHSLTREKRTVDDREHRSRQAASLRALLEDRFAPVASIREIEYTKVRTPIWRIGISERTRPY